MTIAHWFKNSIGGNAAPEMDDTLEESSEDLRDQIIRGADRVEQIANDLVLKGQRLSASRQSQVTPVALEAHDFGNEVVQCKPVHTFKARRMRKPFVVKSEHGHERGEAGDFLVTFPTGRQIVMTAEEFRRSFKPA